MFLVQFVTKHPMAEEKKGSYLTSKNGRNSCKNLGCSLICLKKKIGESLTAMRFNGAQKLQISGFTMLEKKLSFI